MTSIFTNDAFLALLGINVLLAVGLYPMVVTGQLSLGQAGFMGVGAYASSWANVGLGWPVPVAVALGILSAALVAVPIAVGANRIKGIYLIMATLAVGEIIHVSLSAIKGLGGVGGYHGMDAVGYRQIWVVMLAVLVLTSFLMRSRLGVAMRSIRDDEDAAAAAGVSTRAIKIGAIVFGAAITGLAGALFAHLLFVIKPEDFDIRRSFEIALFVLIGGSDSVAGPLTGAFVLTYIPQAFGSVHHYQGVLYGLLLLAVMILSPRGLVTRDRIRRVLRPLWARIRTRPALPGEQPATHREQERPPERTVDAGDLPVLTLDGLGKRFSGVVALRDVDLEVRQGEIVGLIGPNGAGKTTLVNVATGLLRASEGTVAIRGRDVSTLPTHLRVRSGMGRTFQQVRLFSRLTVAENVGVSARARDRGADEVAALLGRLGLFPYADRLPEELAHGTQRKVQVGQALGSGPVILFLDEPSIGLNATELSELAGVIRWIRDSGAAIVLVDHNLDLVMGVADRVVVLDHGERLSQGTPEEVRRDPKVQEAYFGTVVAQKPEAAPAPEPVAVDADRSSTLRVEGLVVRYGKVEALHGVSIRVDPGETVAVVGRNGAGKTTLLRSIFGYVRPSEGSIRLGEVDLSRRPTHAMARMGMGYVPEHRAILGSLSVLENLQLAALGAGTEEKDHLQEVFTLFPVLEERAKEPAAVLSGGQQQMLALGRALMAGPRLLMLDEPSLGLAPKVVDALFAALARLGERGMTILLVEQNVRRALSVASRGYVMNLGRIEIDGPAEKILLDDRLFSTYLGELAPGGDEKR